VYQHYQESLISLHLGAEMVNDVQQRTLHWLETSTAQLMQEKEVEWRQK